MPSQVEKEVATAKELRPGSAWALLAREGYPIFWSSGNSARAVEVSIALLGLAQGQEFYDELYH